MGSHVVILTGKTRDLGAFQLCMWHAMAPPSITGKLKALGVPVTGSHLTRTVAVLTLSAVSLP